MTPFLANMAERSVTVVVSGPPPAYGFSDIRACSRDSTQSCAELRVEIEQPISEVETALEALAEEHHNLRILQLFDTVCPMAQQTCHPSLDGVFSMRDSDHMNAYGASLVQELFLEATSK